MLSYCDKSRESAGVCPARHSPARRREPPSSHIRKVPRSPSELPVSSDSAEESHDSKAQKNWKGEMWEQETLEPPFLGTQCG